MIIPQKRSLRQVIVAGLAALVAPLTGCVTGGSVTPEVGYNMPVKQANIDFDSAVSYGVRGSIKVKNKVEIEAEARFHNTEFNDGFQKNTLNASDLSVGVVIPVWNKGKAEVYAVPKVISRSETENVELIGIGDVGSENRSSFGYGIEVGARFQARKGSVDARISYEGFSKESYKRQSYEKSGINVSLGYHFEF
jgi:hypothetical protein